MLIRGSDSDPRINSSAFRFAGLVAGQLRVHNRRAVDPGIAGLFPGRVVPLVWNE